MTTQTNPRMNEIKAIWQQYQGLYVIGGIFIGLMLFPFLEMVINDLSQLLIGLAPEAIGIGFTVFFLDRIYQKREIEQLKRRLIGEASSQSNETAKSAVDWMRREGWLTGENGLLKGKFLLKAQLQEADLHSANLQQTELSFVNLRKAELSMAELQTAHLRKANLQQAHLWQTNLQGALLVGANLKRADLNFANLQHAYLNGANIQEAILVGANLKGVDLGVADLTGSRIFGADLQGARLVGANLEKVIWQDKLDGNEVTTTLPDGTIWTPDTDMGRFTDPEHPDFWQPANEQ